MANRLNVHDLFFKKSLSDIRVMRDFCQSHLPENIFNALNLSTLKLQSTSFVDKKLQSKISDMLYRVELWHEPGYLYFLCEHQSTPDKLLPFRVLKYVVEIMQHHLSQGNKQLPLIFPIIFYHGIQSPYPHSVDLYDLFTLPEKARDLLFKPLHLIDLSQIPDDDIRTHGFATMLELIQKHIRSRDIVPIVKKLALWGIFKVLEKHGAYDYIDAMIYYLVKTAKTHNINLILDILIEEFPNERDKVMIIAEQLKRRGIKIGFKQGMEKGMEKGMEQGMEKGMEQGLKQGAKKGFKKGVAQGLYRVAQLMLDAGEPIEKVYSYTGLLLHEIKRIHDKDGLDYLTDDDND